MLLPRSIRQIVPGERFKGYLITDRCETSSGELKYAVAYERNGEKGVTMQSQPSEQWFHSFAQSQWLSAEKASARVRHLVVVNFGTHVDGDAAADGPPSENGARTLCAPE